MGQVRIWPIFSFPTFLIKTVNEQVNDVMAGLVTMILIGLGIYLLTNADILDAGGTLNRSTAIIVGWLFIGYGLLRGWLVYKRIRRRREQE